jgi:hypothetical protein
MPEHELQVQRTVCRQRSKQDQPEALHETMIEGVIQALVLDLRVSSEKQVITNLRFTGT